MAAFLKATTDVPNPWLAEELEMGSDFYVSKHVGQLRKNPEHPPRRVLQQIEKVAKVKAQHDPFYAPPPMATRRYAFAGIANRAPNSSHWHDTGRNRS